MIKGELVKLDVQERRELAKLERQIDDGMRTFLEVGTALKAIRDGRLYREKYKTFEKYVSDRFGISRPRAYQLIECVEVAEDLSTKVDKTTAELLTSERHLRELSDVSEDDLPEVIEEVKKAADAGQTITAKVVRAIVDAIIEPEDDETEPEPVANSSPDPAADRARFKIPELVKALRFHLSNIGDRGQFDKALDAILEFAR